MLYRDIVRINLLNCAGVTYSGGLEDLAQAGEVIDACVEGVDRVVEYLQ